MKNRMNVIGLVLIGIAIGMIGCMIVNRYHVGADNVKIQGYILNWEVEKRK